MAVITAQDAGGEAIVIFLDLIAFSEGTVEGQDNGYGVIVTGVDGPESFTDYSSHPFAPSVQYPNGRPAKLIREATPEKDAVYSTASGRYQLLQSKNYPYYEVYKKQLGLPDFSPLSQDKIAIQQIKEHGAIALLLKGQITASIQACSATWASFPGNNYGQGGKSLSNLVNKYHTLQTGV